MSNNHHDTSVNATPAADPDTTITRPGYCSYGYYHNHANLRLDNHRPPHTPADQGPAEHTYSPEAISEAARYVLEQYRGVDVDEDVLVRLVQQRLRGSAHGYDYRTSVRVSWTGTGEKGKDVVVETRQVNSWCRCFGHGGR